MAFTNMFLNGLVVRKKLYNVFSNSIFIPMCSGKSNMCEGVLKRNLTAFLVMVQPTPLESLKYIQSTFFDVILMTNERFSKCISPLYNQI